MKFISITRQGGMDWHDIACHCHFLKNAEGSYDISDTNERISEYVYNEFQQFAKWCKDELKKEVDKPVPTLDEVREMIKTQTSFKFGDGIQTWTDSQTHETVEFYESSMEFLPDKMHIEYEYAAGQITDTEYIDIYDIPDENVRFIVTENFLCPGKGIPSVERFYNYPVKTQKEAEEILEAMQLHQFEEAPWLQSEKQIIVGDIDNFTTSTWYALNILVINKEKELAALNKENPQRAQHAKFKLYAEAHLEELNEARNKWFRTPISEATH